MCCGLASLALGCGEDKIVDSHFQSPAVPHYFTPSAPESTILNYKLAWQLRDSTMIDSVLTNDYAGASVDMADPPSGTLTFTRSDETRALSGIQRDPSITSVSIDLPDPSLWTRTSDPGDPPGWVTITGLRPSIRIFRSDGADVASTGSHMDFKLKPITSGPDTTWKIIRWYEVHQL